MAWCFSIRASVATVLTTHPCVSRCLRVIRAALSSRQINSLFNNKIRCPNPVQLIHLFLASLSMGAFIPTSSRRWGYYPYILSCSQVSGTHLKISYPRMESTSALFSNELYWLDTKTEHKDILVTEYHPSGHYWDYWQNITLEDITGTTDRISP